MAEQNPIKYSDLVKPDDSIEKLISQLERLLTIYQDLTDEVKVNAAQIASSLRSVSGATEEGRKSTRGATEEADRLTKAYKNLTYARSQTAMKVEELKQQTKEEQYYTKLVTEQNRAAEGSYNALSAQYRLNKIALNNLSAEQRKNSEAAKKLEEETRNIYEQMKQLQEATGKFSLNVGNYENAINNVIGVQSKWFKNMQALGELFQNGFANGVRQAGTVVAGFGKQLLALLANPIVATIAAITAAFVALAKGISSSEENTNALMRVLAPFQRVITGILSVLQSIAGVVLKVAEGAEQVAMTFSRWLEKLPLVGGALKSVNDALQKNIDLTREKQMLEKAERSGNEQMAQLARDVAYYKYQAEKTKDLTEKKKWLNKAMKAEAQAYQIEYGLAKKDYEIKKQLAAQADNDKQANDELSAAKIRYLKAQEDVMNRLTALQKKQNKVDNQLDKPEKSGTGDSDADRLKREQEQLAREQEAARQREIQAIRAYQDTKVELMDNVYDQERMRVQYQYDRQMEDLQEQVQKLGDTEIDAKIAINARIIALEELKQKKLSEIADRQMKDAVDAEQRDYEQRIRATDKLIKAQQDQAKKEQQIREQGKQAMQESLDFALNCVNQMIEGYVRAAEQKRRLADADVDRAQRTLEMEIEARNKGYANDVETARKELQLAKETQNKAIADQKRAQKIQEAVDTATQVSSLITASANIWKSLTAIPIVGVALAVAAMAVMWGSFAASKVMAAQVAGSGGSESYGEGTVELLEGGSHQSGNDIDLGRKKDGTRRRAEGGEYFAVINKKNSRRYGELIPAVINSLNDGTFAEKYLGAYDGGMVVNYQQQGSDLRELTDSVNDIRDQGRMKRYSDGHGNSVLVYKNLRQTIKDADSN